MHVAVLAAEVTFLDIFLGIVPGTTGVGHEDGQHEAGTEAADEQAYHARYTEYQSRHDGSHDGQQRGYDHFALSSLGRDGHAAFVVGFGLAGEDALDFAELAAHLLDHVCGGTTYGVHGQSAEEEGHHRTDEHAREHFGVHQGNVVVAHEVGKRGFADHHRSAVGKLEDGLADAGQTDANLLHVRGQQSQTREGGRANGKAFAGSGGGVAQRVEGVGSFAYLFAQAAHLGVTAGVVGNGTVGVGSQSDTQRREHAHGCDTDTVEAQGHVAQVEARGKEVGEDDTGYHGNDGDSR